MRRLVVGDENGNVILYDVEANTKRKMKTNQPLGSVVELHWDPLSENYLLAAFKSGLFLFLLFVIIFSPSRF
jgi:hypothetical protein